MWNDISSDEFHFNSHISNVACQVFLQPLLVAPSGQRVINKNTFLFVSAFKTGHFVRLYLQSMVSCQLAVTIVTNLRSLRVKYQPNPTEIIGSLDHFMPSNSRCDQTKQSGETSNNGTAVICQASVITLEEKAFQRALLLQCSTSMGSLGKSARVSLL